MESRPATLTGRLLEPLESVLWILFLAWTAIGFGIMPFYVGEVQIHDWIENPGLRDALLRFLLMSDAVWIVLGAAVVYLHLAYTEGLRTARQWALIILVSSALLASVGTLSDVPFGPYVYTNRFGVRLADILPFTVPLLWLTIVVSARYIVLAVRPNAGRFTVSAGSGFLALLTDLNLEPVAWKVRAYWIWYPADLEAPDVPPLQNYVTWFLAAALLAAAFPARRVNLKNRTRISRPVIVLGLINALLFTVNCARWLDQ